MQPTLPLLPSSATSSRTDAPLPAYTAAGPQMRSRSDSPRSEFHAAARDGDANTVKRLLAGGKLDPGEIDAGTGMSALMTAASHGHDDIVFLLTRGARPQQVHQQCPQGRTALTLAAAGGHADVVDFLRTKGATQADKDAALASAAAAGQANMIRLLLLQGAQPDQPGADGRTALHHAASGGHEAAAGVLLKAHAKVNAADKQGMTPLMLAAKAARLDMIQTLLAAGADLASRDGQGRTVVDIAVATGDHLLARALASRLAATLESMPASASNTSTATTATSTTSTTVPETGVAASAGSSRLTLLDVVASNDASVLERLLSEVKQSDIDVPAALNRACQLRDVVLDNGEPLYTTPLVLAASQGFTAIVKVLMNAGAAVDQAGHSGSSALMSAVIGGHVDTMRALLHAGANTEQSLNGVTALHLAVQMSQTAAVQGLLAAGAKVDPVCPAGVTPLMLAASRGDGDAVHSLLKAGANPALLDNNGANAVAHAEGAGYTKLAALLSSHPALASLRPGTGLATTVANRPPASSTASATTTTSKRSSSVPETDAAASAVALASSLLVPVGFNDENALKRMLLELKQSGKDVAAEVNRAIRVGKAVLDNGELLCITPLVLAATQGSTAIVKVLLNAGAAVNQAGLSDRSALMFAVAEGHVETVQALLQAGANTEHRFGGCTALHFAVNTSQTAALQALLAAGALVDPVGPNGITPLMLAASRGVVDIVIALLKAGANPALVDTNGADAATCAKNAGHTMLALLISTQAAAVAALRSNTD